MNNPSPFLTRPSYALTPAVIEQFESLYTQAISNGAGDFIGYSLLVPKWLFLCYLGDNKDVVFHGTGDPAITEFEPRQSNDTEDFGNQKAVYGASDALWSMYFAIVDRPRYVRSLVNSCFLVKDSDGVAVPTYFFSVNQDALPHSPWRAGTIYILPKDTFERQRSSNPNSVSTQWRSFEAIKPLAKISVDPEDFPFLDKVRGHDPAVVNRRARENPDGYPWLDE